MNSNSPERKSDDFEEELKQALARASSLEETVRQNEANIRRLEDLQREKDLRIGDLETTLGERQAYYSQIQSGHGWKWLTRYFKIRNKILPPESRRRRLLAAALRGPGAAAAFVGRMAARISRAVKPERRIFNVQVDLTNYCNLKCKMCYFQFQSIPVEARRRLSYDQLVKIVGPWADRIKSLGLSCGAEPLLAERKELLKILGFPREYGIPRSLLTTNATLMDEEVARRIVDSGIGIIQISMDSHLKEKYEMIRVGAHFDRVVENIKYLRDYKKERKSSSPYIQFGCVLMRWNIEDVSDYLDFVHLLGANGVAFQHVVVYQGSEISDQSLSLDKPLANRYLDLIREKCRTHGFHLNTIPENFSLSPAAEKDSASRKKSARRRRRTCVIPQSYIYMAPNGDVLPCPYFYGERPVGNLAQDDFATMWNRKDYVRFRKDVGRGVFARECCKTCPAAGSGEINDPLAFQEKDLEQREGTR